MKTSYAVKWDEPDGRAYVGRLELGPRALHLVGDAGGARVVRQIGYDELEGLRIGHDAGERVDGPRALVIERPQGAYHLTSTAFDAGILQELVDRLSDLSLAPPRRATIVVPLKEGALARVRELAAAGPPFDPNETQLTRHQLLLTAQEATSSSRPPMSAAFTRFSRRSMSGRRPRPGTSSSPGPRGSPRSPTPGSGPSPRSSPLSGSASEPSSTMTRAGDG